MHKLTLTLIVCFTLFFFSSMLKAFSYTNYDNQYKYQRYSVNNEYDTSVSSADEEILFIVDYSSSMNKLMGDYPKYVHAINAIESILNSLEQSTRIGLRLFGISDKPLFYKYGNQIKFNAKEICSASKLVLPITRYNTNNIANKLSRVVPKGASPIGYSLRQSIKNDFSTDKSLKHIILITDGGENCGDDPCLFVQNIMQTRNDIRIDVIGITIEDNAYSQLSCIANYSNGQYFEVNSPEDFKIKINQALNVNMPMRTYMNEQQKSNNSKNIQSIKYKNYAFEFNN